MYVALVGALLSTRSGQGEVTPSFTNAFAAPSPPPFFFPFVADSWSRVATISLASARLVSSPGVYCGALAVEYTTFRDQDTPRTLEVPFHIDYAEGSLDLPALNSAFFVGAPPFEPETRSLTIQNTLSFPVAVSEAHVAESVSDVFQVTHFERERESTVLPSSSPSFSIPLPLLPPSPSPSLYLHPFLMLRTT